MSTSAVNWGQSAGYGNYGNYANSGNGYNNAADGSGMEPMMFGGSSGYDSFQSQQGFGLYNAPSDTSMYGFNNNFYSDSAGFPPDSFGDYPSSSNASGGSYENGQTPFAQPQSGPEQFYSTIIDPIMSDASQVYAANYKPADNKNKDNQDSK